VVCDGATAAKRARTHFAILAAQGEQRRYTPVEIINNIRVRLTPSAH